MKKLLLTLAILWASVAQAQDPPAHSIPIGQGPGVIGWGSVGPCTPSQTIGWVSLTVDPTCVSGGGGGGGISGPPSSTIGHIVTWSNATGNSISDLGWSLSPTTRTFVGNLLANTNVNFPASGTLATTLSANVASVAGTAGQIVSTPPTGAVVLSLPSTITSNETFSGTINFTGTPQVNGVALGTFATQNFATPPAIGGTTPAAGTFTTLSANGAINFLNLAGGSPQCLQVGTTGSVTGTGSGCAAGVTSVTGTSGQITTSPTTGAVVVSLPTNITSNETFSGTVNFTGTTQLNGVAFGTFATSNFATPPVIGGTTPNNATFANLTSTGTTTLNVTGLTQCLQASSTGIISGTGSACGGGGGGPGGLTSQLQYNNAGSFGGISGATSNGTSVTFGNGNLLLGGSSTGSTVFQSSNSTINNFTLTFPALTDAIVTATATQTLTGKTYDTAGTGNLFRINGHQITATSGNTNTVATTIGTLINTHCVEFDASGNLIDAGGTCTTGGGGGTVSAGSANQVAYYPSGGTTVGGNSNLNIVGSNLIVGLSSSTLGQLSLAGSSSGQEVVQTNANAGTGTLLLPVVIGTDTFMVLNTPQTVLSATSFTDGTLLLKGSSSGAMTLKAPAAASAFVMTFPAATDTVEVLGTAQTITAVKTFTNSDIKLLGSSTGATTFTSANAGASNFTLTFPAVTDTLATLGTAQTWTAIQTFTNSDIKLLGSSTGATTFTSANSGASNFTLTFPAVTDTLAAIGTAQTWTAVQTFTNSDIKLLGSSTGATTLTSANSGASNFTLTLPAVNDTLAGIGTAQTWTAAQTFTNSDIKLLGSSTGATTFTSANSGSSNFTLTFPAVTDTIAALGTTQTWTAGQTFTNPDLILLGNSTGFTTLSSLNAGSTNYILQIPTLTPSTTDTVAVLGTANQSMTGGVNLSSVNYATGTITVNCGLGPVQAIQNNAAFTIVAPTKDGTCLLMIRNGANAGTITWSGFTAETSHGDALTTTNGNVFTVSIWRITDSAGSKADYRVAAMQ